MDLIITNNNSNSNNNNNNIMIGEMVRVNTRGSIRLGKIVESIIG